MLEGVVTEISKIRKRDGQVVDFDIAKISNAITKAMNASDGLEGDIENDPPRLAQNVLKDLEAKADGNGDYIPHIETIQNFVERNLIMATMPDTAKRYILYRNERSQKRQQEKRVPERVRKLVEDSRKNFKNEFGEFV